MRPDSNPKQTGTRMVIAPVHSSRLAIVTALGLAIMCLAPPAMSQGGQLRQSGQTGIVDSDNEQGNSNTEQAGQSEDTSNAEAGDQPDQPPSDDTKQAEASGDNSENTGVPASSAPAGKQNTLDKQETVTPTVVRKQQEEYWRLRDEVWDVPSPPAGLPPAVHAPQSRDSGTPTVGLEARNVDFNIDDGVGYHISQLKGELVPETKGEPVNFDDPQQYHIHIFSGEVLIRPRNLQALMNNYILTHEPRSLSSASIDTGKDTLTVHAGARLFRFIPPVGGLPVTLKGPVELTRDNKLVYTPESVTQFGVIPVKPLLSSLGLQLSTLTPFQQTGIQLKGNQLIFNPETVFPPPRLKIDRIDAAELSPKGLKLTFSSATSDAGFSQPPVAVDSYLWIQSGDALFSGVNLVNANMQVMHSGEGPLAFHLYDYRAQAAEGTIHSECDGALVVRLPNDFEDDDNRPTQSSGLRPRGAKAGDG